MFSYGNITLEHCSNRVLPKDARTSANTALPTFVNKENSTEAKENHEETVSANLVSYQTPPYVCCSQNLFWAYITNSKQAKCQYEDISG